MWKAVADTRFPFLCRRILDLPSLKQLTYSKRTFLSEAFRCQEAWERRLKTPILQNIKLEDFYQELDKKFDTDGKASAIDIDLFANAMRDESYIDELEELLHKLRLSPNTTYTLPSTHHAVIRSYLKFGKYEDLFHILNDRLNYGIFPDDYCNVLLMDTFLKEKKYTDAAKISVLQMLQEDWSHPVVSHLALYSCYMYLKNPGEWADPTATEEPEDDGEEIKVRVKYLRNPYFDDHFDLRDPKLLVGKTLASLGVNFPDAVGRTFQLIGWGMYQKWEKALALLENILKEKQKPAVFREGVEMFKESVKELKEEDGPANEMKSKLSKLIGNLESSGLVTEEDLHDAILKKVESVVPLKEQQLLEDQKKLYTEWEKLREKLLQEQLQELDKKRRLEKVKEEKEKLEKREEVIFFFDNEEKWELKIEEKRKFYKKRYFGKKKKPRSTDASYVPPEVKQAKV